MPNRETRPNAWSDEDVARQTARNDEMVCMWGDIGEGRLFYYCHIRSDNYRIAPPCEGCPFTDVKSKREPVYSCGEQAEKIADTEAAYLKGIADILAARGQEDWKRSKELMNRVAHLISLADEDIFSVARPEDADDAQHTVHRNSRQQPRTVD